MGIRLLQLVAVVCLLLGAGGCTDAVTLPGGGEGRAPDLAAITPLDDGQLAYVCCDPVIVIVPRCDPYMELDWCKDDGGGCISSRPGTGDPEADAGLAGCGESGGSGGSTLPGGGGSPAAPNPCPDYGCPPPDEPCDPRYDAKCNRPFTSADSATLRLAIRRHVKPASQFADSAQARQCGQLIGEFNRLYAAGRVFRGNSTTLDGHPLSPAHVALYSRASGTMHFEPSALDAANGGDRTAIRNLLNSALHEAAHALGYDHTDPVWAGNYDLFAEPPFDLLSPGANSCIINW